MKKLLSIVSIVLVMTMLLSVGTIFAAIEKFPDYNKVHKGLWQGYPDGFFKPNRTVSRVEFLKILYLYDREIMFYGRNNNPLDEEELLESLPFNDVSRDSWYYKYVSWAYGAGIIKGEGGDILNPNGEITVYEFALICYRYLEFRKLSRGSNGKFNLYKPFTTDEIWEWGWFSQCSDSYANAKLAQDIPAWFTNEVSMETICTHGIWIGGTNESPDMNLFSNTRASIEENLGVIEALYNNFEGKAAHGG